MVDQEKIRQAVQLIIEAIGENADREGLVGTPKRIAQMYDEVFWGLDQDPKEVLMVGFEEEQHQEMVIVRDIPFYSMCEHHFLPFHGTVHVGYIPNGRIVGLSKVARVVDILSRRPQVQERLTSQIADTFVEALQPDGVGVVIEAVHLCMTMRGVRKSGAVAVTSANRGLFRRRPATRAEFISLIQNRR
jgi:GTP cyclohydrolase I